MLTLRVYFSLYALWCEILHKEYLNSLFRSKSYRRPNIFLLKNVFENFCTDTQSAFVLPPVNVHNYHFIFREHYNYLLDITVE